MDTNLLDQIMLGLLKRQIIISTILIVICILATIVGVAYFKQFYQTAKHKAFGVLLLALICLVVITILRFNTTYSCYKDYTEKNYVTLKDTNCRVKYGNVGIFESVHTLSIKKDSKTKYLKVQERKEALLSNGEYFGLIVYSQKSSYVLYYDLVKR